MKQYITKSRIIVSVLAPLLLLLMLTISLAAKVLADVPPPSTTMNYVYSVDTGGSTCPNNDLPVYGETNPTLCLQILSVNLPSSQSGYTVSAPSVLGGGCGGAGEVSYEVTDTFGQECINITDASKWDTTTYNSAASTTTPAPVSDPAAICAAKSSTCQAGLFSNFINPAINFLSAGVGVIIVIAIIMGGIRYASAGDDPQKVQAARSQILNALIALVAFIFMYGFLQWVIPGGLV